MAETDTASGADDGHTHERACLNCGCALAGDFCHCCGQRAHVHRTLGAFWHDLAHGVLHFEGKIWHTLPLLVWKPGELTRRYIDGQRARFISPIALFLFSVFLMFAVFELLGGALDVGGFEQINRVDINLKQRRAEIHSLEAARGKLVATHQATGAIDRQIKTARDEADTLDLMARRGVTEATMVQANQEVVSKSDWLNRAYIDAKKNPTLLIYKLRTNAYKFGWLLIPLSVPLMWLLFPFSRRFRAYDHTVFVTYSLSFMTIWTIAVSLAAFFGIKALVAAMVLFVPVHMFRQLKAAYGLSTPSALWRTLVLLLFAWLALVLFALAILVLGVRG